MDHNKHPEQDRRFSDAVTGASKRWSSMENRMDALEEKLDRNTEMTETIVNLFSTMESGMKFLGWLGAALKWAVTVAGACAALWAMIHGKDTPQ
jgi:hypothetical protein